jgi:hypothetical protein
MRMVAFGSGAPKTAGPRVLPQGRAREVKGDAPLTEAID